MRVVTIENDRRKESLDDVPGGSRRFRAVERVVVRHALTDADGTAVLDGHQHESPIGDAAEARLEEPDERKAQEPQLDPIDSHATMLSQSPGRFRYTSLTAPASRHD